MKIITQSTIVIGLFAGLAIPAIADEDEQTVAWENVPAAVQNTITANANGGTIGRIEKENEKGVTTYEAKIKGSNGEKMEVEAATDGTLVETETIVKWNDIPPAVQNTITANAHGGKVGKVEQETEKGVTTYEAKVKADNKKIEINVATDGTLIKASAEDEDDDKDSEHKDKDDKD